MGVKKFTPRITFFLQKRRGLVSLIRHRLKGLVIFLGLVIISFSLYLFFASGIFKVQEVKISFEENKRIDRTALEDKLRGQVQGLGIIFLDTKEVEEKLKETFLPLEAIRFKKKLPNRLEVQIKEREPLLKVIIGGSEYLVDKSGLLFSESIGSEKLPSITLEDQLNLGDFIDSKEVTFILQILMSLNPESVQSVSLQGGDVIKLRYEETDIFLSILKDAREQLDTLGLIQESYRIRGRRLKRIDLRFKRPVIEY